MTESEFLRATQRGVESSAGWSAEFLGPELIEYRQDRDSCLVNVGFNREHQARAIYATEAQSSHFPSVHEHLRAALPLLPGRYVVV
jgi:hypothetical protein